MVNRVRSPVEDRVLPKNLRAFDIIYWAEEKVVSVVFTS